MNENSLSHELSISCQQRVHESIQKCTLSQAVCLQIAKDNAAIHLNCHDVFMLGKQGSQPVALWQFIYSEPKDEGIKVAHNLRLGKQASRSG